MLSRRILSLEDSIAAFDAGPAAEWLEADRTAINLERAIQEIRGEINRQDVSLPPPSLRHYAA